MLVYARKRPSSSSTGTSWDAARGEAASTRDGYIRASA